MSSQEPSAKRQKTFNADGPIEEDEAAREKLREAGFDPDDVHTAISDLENSDLLGGESNVTPMAHFSCCADLPMCRYLHHVRGAVTTRAADEHLSEPDIGVRMHPILAAAYGKHHDWREIETIQWLYENGAKSELLLNVKGSSAISVLFDQCYDDDDLFPDCLVDFAKWLVFKGFLEDDAGITDQSMLGRLVYEMQRENDMMNVLEMMETFRDWLNELLAPSDAFHTFLLGTARKPQYSVAGMKEIVAARLGNVEAASMFVDGAISNGNVRDIWDKLMPSNACLASFPGVLEKIADYVGIIKSKPELRRVEGAHAAAKESLFLFSCHLANAVSPNKISAFLGNECGINGS